MPYSSPRSRENSISRPDRTNLPHESYEHASRITQHQLHDIQNEITRNPGYQYYQAAIERNRAGDRTAVLDLLDQAYVYFYPNESAAQRASRVSATLVGWALPPLGYAQHYHSDTLNRRINNQPTYTSRAAHTIANSVGRPREGLKRTASGNLAPPTLYTTNSILHSPLHQSHTTLQRVVNSSRTPPRASVANNPRLVAQLRSQIDMDGLAAYNAAKGGRRWAHLGADTQQNA